MVDFISKAQFSVPQNDRTPSYGGRTTFDKPVDKSVNHGFCPCQPMDRP